MAEGEAADADEGRSPDGTFSLSRADFSDGREKGDFASRFSRSAWIQIGLEGAYLSAITALAASAIVLLARSPQYVFSFLHIIFDTAPRTDTPNIVHALQLWLIVFFAGILGGATFSTKWLYHSVSWNEWNRDRIVWRLSVPILGGLMAVFTGCMIMSGIIPLLSKDLFARMVSGAGFGFFVGLFADNFLAALQKFATRLLGTLGSNRRRHRRSRTDSEHCTLRRRTGAHFPCLRGTADLGRAWVPDNCRGRVEWIEGQA